MAPSQVCSLTILFVCMAAVENRPAWVSMFCKLVVQHAACTKLACKAVCSASSVCICEIVHPNEEFYPSSGLSMLVTA